MTIVFILFVFWAFFAGSETAFVSSNRFKLYNLRKRGRRTAQLACFLLEKPERLLATTLIGTNLSLVLSANLTARIYIDLFGQPKPFLSVLTITIFSLLFCEVFPKNLAMIRSLKWTMTSSVPLTVFYIVFYPVGKIFSFLTKIVIRIMGIPHTGLIPSLFRRKEDVRFFLSTQLESQYTKDESRYFQDTLDFGEKTVSDVMVPLIDINAVPNTAKVRECHKFIQKYRNYAIPVYRERIDNIVGIIFAHDLFDRDKNLAVTHIMREPVFVPEYSSISHIMREPVFVPEYSSISQLYRDSYDKGLTTVFAVDEYGGITGLATMYDIGEEIVGRLNSFEEKSLIVRVQEHRYLCDGDAEIDEINNVLSIEIEHEDFSTLNGLFLKELGKIPVKGDTIDIKGYRFTVEKGSRKKADIIRIEKQTK
jgi:CBS domain containing-hemolysin-like protein